MKGKFWKRTVSIFITGLMAAQVICPVVAYADDSVSSNSESTSENSDTLTDTENAQSEAESSGGGVQLR